MTSTHVVLRRFAIGRCQPAGCDLDARCLPYPRRARTGFPTARLDKGGEPLHATRWPEPGLTPDVTTVLLSLTPVKAHAAC